MVLFPTRTAFEREYKAVGGRLNPRNVGAFTKGGGGMLHTIYGAPDTTAPEWEHEGKHPAFFQAGYFEHEMF